MPVRKQAKNRAVFLDRDGVVNRVILRDGKPCAPARILSSATPMASAGCRGVEGTFRISSRPPRTKTQSVKVPPATGTNSQS